MEYDILGDFDDYPQAEEYSIPIHHNPVASVINQIKSNPTKPILKRNNVINNIIDEEIDKQQQNYNMIGSNMAFLQHYMNYHS